MNIFDIKQLVKVNKKCSILLIRSLTKRKQTNKYDMIGPVDKLSNLRQIKYYIPENETKLEKDYREMRQRIADYNNQYWSEQNISFIESRREFSEKLRNRKILEILNKQDELNKSTATEATTTTSLNDSIEMNEFYKSFLNENYHKHYIYNREWFKLNLSMLIPALRVFTYRLFNRTNKN